MKLIFAGSGPRKEELIKYIKKCKIDMPIMKFYDRDELVNVINYSDLYCHPAEVELEGIACLEAITTGLVPVVNCSKRAATKEFAIDRNCCFKFNDSNDLKNKIDFWIENKELKEEYSDKYLSKVSIYRQDDCMEKMLNMMKDVINNAKNNILS